MGELTNDEQEKSSSKPGNLADTSKNVDTGRQDSNLTSILDVLQKIGDLRNKGILTDDEFTKLKSKILANVEDEELVKLNAKHPESALAFSQAKSSIKDSVRIATGSKHNFLTYYNYSLEFKIQFPSNWGHEKDNVSSSFYSPKTPNNSGVSLVIERWSAKDVSFEQYKNEKMNSLQNKYKRLLRYELLESSLSVLGGIQGLKTVYVFSPPNEESIQKMEFWMLNKGLEYHIVYTALKRDYSNYLQTVQYMLESFELLEDSQANNKNYAIYENSDHGIRIKYPTDWEGLELNQPIDNNKGTHIVRFAVVNKLEYRLIIPIVDLTVANLSSHGIPLDALMQDNIFGMRKNYNSKLVESSSLILAGNSGKKLVCVTEGLYLLRVFTIIGNKVYYIDYVDDIKKYNQTLPIVQKMIDSLEIMTAAQASNPPEPPTSLSIYENTSFGIKIHYPVVWTADEKRYDPNDNRQMQVVGFLIPLQNNFIERVGIYVKTLTHQDQSLEEYVNIYMDNIREKSKRLSLILQELNPTTLARHNAYRIVYKIKSLYGDDIKTTEFITIKDNKSYIITYSAELEKYSDYLPDVEKMVNSFEITK